MSFWKNFGKIALKVAPYAAMAIPGVGVPLGMAIQGGLAAANAKANGGTWKNALLSGGIGAAGGAVGAGALKGIGPTSGVMSKLAGGAAGKGGLGVTGAVGESLGNIGKEAASNAISNIGKNSSAQNSSIGPTDPSQFMSDPMSNPTQGDYNQGAFKPMSSLADAINSGRQSARKRMAFA